MKKRRPRAAAATKVAEHAAPLLLENHLETPAVTEAQPEATTKPTEDFERLMKEVASLHEKAGLLEKQAQQAEQRRAGLEKELDEARAQLGRMREEIESLRRTYQKIGPGTLALASRVDALKRRAPWLIAPVAAVVRLVF
jgi:uncharacterized coiled-coil DUF342 family protein